MLSPPRILEPKEFPSLLHEIPQPPKELYICGELPSPDLKLLTVVGSRKYTDYGKMAVDHLISGLAGYPVGIISGLALGIDSLAHEAALRYNLYTMAILGNGLSENVLYPAKHKSLARRIIESGGSLLSEYPPDTRAARWTFPERNRLQAGISHATLLIEAAEKSGTLITARLATDYNRELLVVPGSIFSTSSKGTHQFLKLGATPVTTPEDILESLNIRTRDIDTTQASLLSETSTDPHATILLSLLHEPTERDELIRASKIPAQEANMTLTLLEIEGTVTITNGTVWRTK